MTKRMPEDTFALRGTDKTNKDYAEQYVAAQGRIEHEHLCLSSAKARIAAAEREMTEAERKLRSSVNADAPRCLFSVSGGRVLIVEHRDGEEPRIGVEKPV